MSLRAFIASLLLAVVATAQQGPIALSKGRVNAITYTTADVNLFVDPTGSDSNPCTSTGTAACLTFQGALDKAPKYLRHKLTVTAAAGSYTGFYVSGFTIDLSAQRASGGILITGALANATGLASGTATGTATAVNAGSHATYGTLTDAAQTWTVNDLRGRFLTLVTGTGAGEVRVISSNTATEITVAGATFTGGIGTTYAVQDSSVLISTGIASPATPIAASVANNAAIWLADNQASYNSGSAAIVVKNLRFTNASANGVVSRGSSQLTMQQLQFAAGSTTSNRILATDGASLNLVSISSMTASTTLTHVTFSHSSTNAIVHSLLQNGSRGLVFTAGPNNTVNGVETINTQTVPFEARRGAIVGYDGARAACATVVGNAGYRFGSQTAGTTNSVEYAAGTGLVDRSDVSGCDFGISVRGAVNVDVPLAFTGTTVANVFDVRFGGQIIFETAPTVTGSAVEISLDGATVSPTSTFAAVTPAGNCITSMASTSRVCRN